MQKSLSGVRIWNYFLYSFWACAIGGYIAVPIDPSKNNMVDRLLSHVLEHADHPIVLIDHYTQEQSNAQVINLQNFYDEILRCPDYMDADYQSSPDDILYVLYSSGTTGTPKGVIIKKSNVTANVYGFAGIIPSMKMTDFYRGHH